MGYDNTGRNITRKCPVCNGKLYQMEGCHTAYGGDGFYYYLCDKCGKKWETENTSSTKCRGKLRSKR